MVFLEILPICMLLFKPAKILRKIEFEGLTRIILTTALAAVRIIKVKSEFPSGKIIYGQTLGLVKRILLVSAKK
jgi:hypothetical protein